LIPWSQVVVAYAIAIIVAGCSEDRPPTPSERGRRIYLAVCTTCHHPDPRQVGGTGPAIAGSSRALIEARVLHASYPVGYTPQRATKAMVALPHLAPYIDDLSAFLSPLAAREAAASNASLP